MAKTAKRKPTCTPVCEVNNPDRHPFQANVEILLDVGMPIQNGIVIVPAGKRLVVEYVSGQAFLPSGQKALFSIFCRAGDDGVWHYVESSVSAGFGSPDCFVCGQVVRLYADPETGIALRVERNSVAGKGDCHMSLSGHFVTVPS